MEGREDVKSAAVRETLEETGLQVRPLRLAYLQEGVWPGHRLCKFWFYCELLSGELEINANGVVDENLVGAEFMSRAQLRDMTVLPKLLKDRFWTDLEDGFSEPKFLDVEAFEVY